MTIELSNYLCDRADVAGEAFQRHRRATREAVEAYLEAGAVLLEARTECTRRGQWGAVLSRAAIEPRNARYMMQIARAGATVADVEEAGGLRAYRESLVEIAEPGSAINPETDEVPPPPAADEPTTSFTDRDSLPDAPADSLPPTEPAVAHITRATGDELTLSPQARRRADKRARGDCYDCTNPATQGVYCDLHFEQRSLRRKQQRVDARTGAALRPRLVLALQRGIGVRLSAEDVAELTRRLE